MPTEPLPVQPTSGISPLIPLVASLALLLVVGTAAIFLPPYLLSLQTHRGESNRAN